MVKDEITFPDFQKLDLRVGKVVKAENLEGSSSLIRMTVNLGEEYGKRKIIAGIAKWYKCENLKGKKFIFVANLAPKQMMKEMSHGMILCADLEGKAKIIPVDNKIATGTVIR